MTIVQPKRTTAAEFEARYADRDGRAELIHGEVIEMSPTTPPHRRCVMHVLLPIGRSIEEHQLGKVHGAETSFIIQHADSTESVLAPDLAFIRVERLPDEDPQGFWRIPPDVARYIRSESERLRDVQKKIALWLEGGAQLICYVNPSSLEMSVHRADGTAQTLTIHDTLSGEDMLPDFELPVQKIFRRVKTFEP